MRSIRHPMFRGDCASPDHFKMTIGPTLNRVAGKSGSSKPQSFSIRKRRRGDR
jgi:hypothetical protein